MDPATTIDNVPRIVALGGGTGLPAVLGGLAGCLGPRLDAEPDRLTGIVTVTDDGGSSGRLRGRGIFPPGDVRNCLVALARDPHSLSEVFQYRYPDSRTGGDGLGGHTLGNLILAALAEHTGCALEAIGRAGRVLGVRGRLLPSTLADVSLAAEMDDGALVRGESALAGDPRSIRRLRLDPARPAPAPEVLDAIERADLIVMSPGSLFTSLMPIFLVDGVAAAIRGARGLRVLVGNLMTEPGETDHLGGDGHLRALEDHVGPGAIDVVLAAGESPPSAAIDQYAAEGQEPVVWTDEDARGHGVSVVRRPLLAATPKVRHEPARLAEGLMGLLAAGRRCEVSA